uniref:Toll-like receptor 6 n=2 Tax=Scleropages formosus TaxID=113540 RepID=A0A8C9SDU2_SCLFO
MEYTINCLSILSALYFHLLLLTADGRMSHQREPMFCKVSSDNRVDLLNQHLTEVPRNLPRSTQYLDLSHNNITHLHDQDLMGLPDLCVLKITHNGLQDISPSVFQGNPKVQILNISYNALRIIPELNLPNLIILDISENLYGSYTLRKSYKDLLSLSYLALGSPQARSVHLADFAPLHEISLRKLQLGGGVELDHYEAGSLAQLPVIQDLTLKMTFCEHPEAFQSILQDLDQTKTESLTLIKFVPDLCNVSSDITDKLRNMTYLGNLTFQDTWFNSSVLAKVVCNIIQSPVKALLFLNITYAEDTDGFKIHDIPGYNKTSEVEFLTFDTIHHYQYSFPVVSINSTFFQHITQLKFSGTGMSIIPCDLISVLPSLQILDLSDNLLRERGLWWVRCSFSHVFPALRRLYLRNNKFEDLEFTSNHTHGMKNLTVLDLSANSFKLIGKTSWPSHLSDLSLSDNTLGDPVFNYLSPYLQRVNLSHTDITALTQEALSQLPSLKSLFLSSNNINHLPPDLSAPQLEELHIDQNNINTLKENSFKGLSGLKRFKAGKNPFACTCDMYWFVTSFNKSLLIDWPSDYICSSPDEMAGMALEKYHPGWVSCTPWIQAVISQLMTLTVVSVLGFTFYIFDGAWYLRMLWVWLRVKKRGHKGADRLKNAIFKYHAFISYSQKDSEWVDNQLVPNLEAAQFSLCIHERDFVPGDWIIDNIINCVERSYKTLFVLSHNFVQSEWCNYELFFAQHRAMSIQQDSLVFILLEPIPTDSLPKKFLKLRTLLRQQTYLEWHKDERKQQVFWASLRSMLKTADKNMVLERVAKEMTDVCPLITDTD